LFACARHLLARFGQSAASLAAPLRSEVSDCPASVTISTPTMAFAAAVNRLNHTMNHFPPAASAAPAPVCAPVRVFVFPTQVCCDGACFCVSMLFPFQMSKVAMFFQYRGWSWVASCSTSMRLPRRHKTSVPIALNVISGTSTRPSEG
jgi:hypothetical protein